VPSFGAKLRQQREQRGVSLDEISNTTKISTRMLQALEEDHFEQLPGGIFNKGFIRAYARVVGMDEDEVIADYLAAISPPDPEAKAAPEQRAPDLRISEVKQPTSHLPWEVFAVVLLIAAIGFAGWGLHSRERERSNAPAAEQPSPTPATSTPVAPVPAAVSVKTAPPTPSALTLRIGIEDDCWVSIKTDGREILRDTVAAPAVKTVHAEKQIIVRAGDISALNFEFNGKKLPPQGDEGEVKTLIFDATGWRVAAPPPQPAPAQPASPPPAISH